VSCQANFVCVIIFRFLKIPSYTVYIKCIFQDFLVDPAQSSPAAEILDGGLFRPGAHYNNKESKS
jgi:hypothetical protein